MSEGERREEEEEPAVMLERAAQPGAPERQRAAKSQRTRCNTLVSEMLSASESCGEEEIWVVYLPARSARRFDLGRSEVSVPMQSQSVVHLG